MRGGRRPGAGRPKGARTKYSGPVFNDLTEIMAAVSRGEPKATLPARAVVALRVLGADAREIAAVLQLSAAEMGVFKGYLELGDVHRRCSLLHGLDAAAAGRNGKPSVPAMIYLMRVFDGAACARRSRRSA